MVTTTGSGMVVVTVAVGAGTATVIGSAAAGCSTWDAFITQSSGSKPMAATAIPAAVDVRDDFISRPPPGRRLRHRGCLRDGRPLRDHLRSCLHRHLPIG